jgi:hypothetical protein
LLGLEIELDGGRVFALDLKEGVSDKMPRDLLVRHGSPIRFDFFFDVAPTINQVHLELRFSNMEMLSVAQCSSVNAGRAFANNSPSATRIRLSLPELLFNKGCYAVSIALMEEHVRGVKLGEILCSYDNIAQFQVSADSVLFGAVPVQLRAKWEGSDS